MGRSRLTNSLMRQGSVEIHQAPRRMGHGNAIMPTFRSARRSIISAALSASIRNGMGHVLPSVRRVRMKPGHTTETRIPSGASMPRRDRPHVFTQLFVAEYAGHALSGPYPAMEAVMTAADVYRESAPRVCLCLLAGGDASVSEDAFERGFVVASLKPATSRVLVRHIEDLLARGRAELSAGLRDGDQALLASSAEEEPVAAFCAGERERLADARARPRYQRVHALLWRLRILAEVFLMPSTMSLMFSSVSRGCIGMLNSRW